MSTSDQRSNYRIRTYTHLSTPNYLCRVFKRARTGKFITSRRFLASLMLLLWIILLVLLSDACDDTIDSVHEEVHRTPTIQCELTSITLVSAFLDIGDYKKGTHNFRNSADYFRWSSALGYIQNHLMFFTDSEKFAAHVTHVRSRLHPGLTHIIHVNRRSQWPFNLQEKIAHLYSDANYPKFHPNTVLPEYSCIMHFKYTCMLEAISQSARRTANAYAWVDLGYFRPLKIDKDYCLVLPNNFKEDKVSFGQIELPNFSLSTKDIFYKNLVWVGGGMFVATRDTMVKFCHEYRRAMEFLLLRRNLSSTDQQCLYAMYTDEGRRDINVTVELQVTPRNKCWFHLGLSSLRRFHRPLRI